MLDKKFWGVWGLLVLGTVGLFAQEAYDSDKVVAVMQTNLAKLKEIGKAIKSQDFTVIAADFTAIVDANKPLLKMNPPRAKKADWDKMLGDVIASSKKGAAAAKAQDIDAVKAVFADLDTTKKAGHAEFDPE